MNQNLRPARQRARAAIRYVVVFASAITLVADVNAAATKGTPHAAVAVKLIIWPRQPNSLTGARMTVTVDSQSSRTLSNLKEQEMIDVGELTPGVHSFSLGAITAFMVDQNGAAQQANNGAGTCAGQFLVSPFQQYYVVMAASQDGLTFQCQIR